jgi:hypothetical protein
MPAPTPVALAEELVQELSAQAAAPSGPSLVLTTLDALSAAPGASGALQSALLMCDVAVSNGEITITFGRSYAYEIQQGAPGVLRLVAKRTTP